MSVQPMFEDAGLQRMEQATVWLQRMHAAGQDDRVVDAWLDWCQRDPLNQQAFDEMAAIWEISGQLAREPQPAAVEAKVTPSRSRRYALAASVAVLALASIGGGWWFMRPTPEQVLTREYSSPIGVNNAYTLADGSKLELGGGTRVTVDIGPHARRVELHAGELFVTVHHDTSRPFSVDTGQLEVVATGTAFNVLRTRERTTVTVAEGSVAAFHEGREANVRVRAGQQLVYSGASHSFDPREVDPREASAWRTGRLYFNNVPLAEVIETINRYTAGKIVIEDPRVGELAFGGTAYADRIESWLDGLPDIFPVAVQDLADGRRQIVPRSGGRSD